MSDFSDRPFVAGSLIGVRAFDVDGLGRLVGPTYPQVFKPGENVAGCFVGSAFTKRSHSFEAALDRLNGKKATPVSPAPARPQHQVGNVNCGCGFYAYFDGSNTYGQHDRVTAVVEGYGVCTVGDRGFRAEKARLVALVDPARPSLGKRIHTLYDRVADWSEDREHLVVPGCVSAGCLSIAATTCAFIAPPWTLLLLVAAIALMACAVFVGKAEFHSISRQYPDVSPEVARCPVQPRRARRRAPDMSAVFTNYPDVPVFRSLGDATSAFPLTPPEPDPIPSPESHADFWDMEVPR